MSKRVLSLFTAFVLCFSLLPTMFVPAAATETAATEGKAVTHGINVINGYDSTSDSYSYVYYGTRDGKGIKWRVLDDETLDGNAGFFLLMEDAIGGVQFISYCTVGTLDSYKNNCWMYRDDMRHNWWENSTARIWCRAFTEQVTPNTALGFSTNQRTLGDALYNGNKASYDQNYSTFSEFEREKILETTKTDPNYKGNYLYYGRNLNGEKVFFLSASEASDASYGLNKDKNRTADYVWMTRSAADRDCIYYGDLEYQFGEKGINDAGIAAIYPAGYLSDWGVYTAILDKVGNVPRDIYKFYPQTASARPAMNIDYDSIVFTSAPDAAWEKTFDLLEDYSGNEWKLTLGTGDSFSADLDNNILSDNGIDVTHPALNSIGTAEYNVVTAELKNADGETVAYGKLNTSDVSATVSTLPLPNGLADGVYTLTLRAEQWNGQNRTNYASEAYEAGTIYVGRNNSHDGHDFTPIVSEAQLAAMTADDYGFLIVNVTSNPETVYNGHLCLNGFTVSGDMQVCNFALYDDDGKNGKVDGGLTLTEGTLALHGGTVNGDISLMSGELALAGGIVNGNEEGYSVVAGSGTTVSFPGKTTLNGETAGLYLKSGAVVSAAGIVRPARPYTVELENGIGSFCTDWDETLDYARYFSGVNGYSVNRENTVLLLVESAHSVPEHPACGASCDHDGSHPVISDWQVLTGSEAALTVGNYILSSNITLDHSIEITGDVNLCLNGYVLALKDDSTSLIVAEDGILTISDCSANQTGRIDGKAATGRDPRNSGAVIVNKNGTLKLYTGTIKDASCAVMVNGYGNFDMYDGTISDSKYGVYNRIIGQFHMYGGTIKGCEYGVNAIGNTELYAGSLINACTKYGVYGDRRSAMLGGTISNCDVGFSSGTLTDGGVVENCRIGANQYAVVNPGGVIRNCTEYGVYAAELVMTGGSVTGCNVGVYLSPQKAVRNKNLMTVSGAPVISGNTTANVAVYSEIDDKSYSKVDVDAIYIGTEGISADAVIPVRVITKDGDFESYNANEWRSYTFSGVYPTRDYSRYFKGDVQGFHIVHGIETNQLAFSYWNGSYKRDNEGKPIRCRILCYLQYNANGGSGSIDYSTLDDGYRSSRYTPYTCVRAASITNGDGRLIANPFAAPAGKVFAGWNTKADGSGVAYADKDLFRYSYTNGWYNNKETVILYAQWANAGGINVAFDANGGTCTTNSQSVKYGTTYSNLPTPTREGYDFIGWYTERDGGNQVNNRSMVSTLSDHTLYAHWKENGFIISYAPNGGSGTMASVGGIRGEYSLPECMFTPPSGQKFKAWKVDEKEYAPGDMIIVSRHITVTAVWLDKETVKVNEEIQTYGYDAATKEFVIKGNNAADGFKVKYQKDGLDVVSPTDAGTYDVIIERAEDDTYRQYSNTITGGLVITPKNITGKATVGDFTTMTYNGKEQTPQALVTTDGLTATGEWSKVTNVTDKTTFTANGNFTGTIADQSTGMLKALSGIAVEPSAKLGLVYDKTAQVLITAGEADGGVVKYSIDNKATWSEELPKGVNAGKYEVYFKVFGDANHIDSDTYLCNVSIAKASVNIPVIASKVYNGSLQTASISDTEYYTVGENNGGINVGRYDVKLLLKEGANYCWDGKSDDISEITLDFNITKADNEWMTAPGIAGWTYGGVASAPICAAKFGDVKVEYKKVSEEDSAYTTEVPTNAGSYKVCFTVDATADFGGLSKIIDLSIAKADVSVTAPTAKENLVYSGSALALTTGGSAEGGEIQFSESKDGAYSTGIITGINAGSYEIWYRVVGDSNHNDAAPVKINVSVAKATQSAPVSPIAVRETIKGKSDGKITGVDSAMEYKADNASEYTAVAGNEVANLSVGTYKVRYKETDNYFAGSDKILEISAGEMITVAFESNGGTAVDSKTCEYNQTITAPETEPTKEGYEFVGWFADSGLVNEWNFDLDRFTENKTLCAKWVRGTVSDGEGDVDGVKADGLNDIAKAEKTDISLIVQEQETAESNEGQTAIKRIADALKNFDFYDIVLKKSTGGTITEATGVIEIRLPYDFIRKSDIKVYRCHNGNAQELAQLTERKTVKPFTDGTCFVDMPNGCIYIYSSKFSTYSVAYDRMSSGSGGSEATTSFDVRFETNGAGFIGTQTVAKNGVAKEPDAPKKDGYIFDGWYINSDFSEKYDFGTRVTKNLTLYAKWKENKKPEDNENKDTEDDSKDKPNDPGTHDCPSSKFDDLDISMWYHSDTDYVLSDGLMKGTAAKTFEPDRNLTRAMFVTILCRNEGEPEINENSRFTDVEEDAYYYNAVLWAQQKGIVKGISETEFVPDAPVTREQIAAIMHRYAKFKGIDVSAGEDTNILSYSDFDMVFEYAVVSMQWAVGSGLINGRSETTLNPKDNATRAEIAAILHRFLKNNK